MTTSTIGEEKRHNPRLGNNQTREGYMRIMSDMDLEKPQKIDLAVAGNQRCGISAAEGLVNQAGVIRE
jgi:hypothetical protein